MPDALPRLILIGNQFTDEDTSERIVEAVRGGVRWVHLRDHAARSDAFALAAPRLMARIRAVAPDAAVSVNGRLEVARHLALHYHARTHPDAVAEARRELAPSTVVGYSAHTEEEAERAAAAGADYVFISPIFATQSKPGQEPIGLEPLARVASRLNETPRPSDAAGDALRPERAVYALGGITPENAVACLEAGAHGIAVLSGILHSDTPADAARDYLAALAQASSSRP